MWVVHQRSHYIVSVALAGFHKSFPSISLSMTLSISMLMYKKQTSSSTVDKKAPPKRNELDPYIYIYIYIHICIYICVFELMPKWA